MDTQLNLKLPAQEMEDFKKACDDKQINVSKRLRKFIEIDTKFLNDGKNIFELLK